MLRKQDWRRGAQSSRQRGIEKWCVLVGVNQCDFVLTIRPADFVTYPPVNAGAAFQVDHLETLVGDVPTN